MKYRVLTKTVVYQTYEVEAGSADEAEASIYNSNSDKAVRTAEEPVMVTELESLVESKSDMKRRAEIVGG